MLETLLSNRTVSVLWEALPRILSAGLTMTIPLTLVSFTLAMVLAVAVALVQYARVPVLSQLARFVSKLVFRLFLDFLDDCSQSGLRNIQRNLGFYRCPGTGNQHQSQGCSCGFSFL